MKRFFSIVIFSAICAAQSPVFLKPIRGSVEFAEAVQPGSLQRECSVKVEAVEKYLRDRGLPFEPRLVRQEGRQHCHLFYEPTVKGFRASPDNDPVEELFIDIHLPGFLGMRAGSYGNSLDVAKQMLPEIPRPLRVTFGTPQVLAPELYPQALAFHFPKSIHTMGFREGVWKRTNPWVQDYLKSGVVDGKQRILVTRAVYEGRVENARLLQPLLNSLREERFERSKLAWEGGDLQFVRHPQQPGKLVLFYGDSAKKYWGASLSAAEFEYVLKLEFGADEARDFTDVTSHVDYFVSFLPAQNIALVSQPERENYDVARAALEVLSSHFQIAAVPEIKELERLFASRESAFGTGLPEVRRLLKKVVAEGASWPAPVSRAIGDRVERYIAQNCPDDPETCVNPDGVSKMLATDRQLLQLWSNGAAVVKMSEALPARMAAVIESQLPGFNGTVQGIVNRKSRELEAMGFRVVKVPRLAGDPALGLNWPGISYANSTLIDNLLFMPAFGLGAAERDLQERMQAQLPQPIRIVPIYARNVLLFNGGVHCTTGLVRRVGQAPRN